MEFEETVEFMKIKEKTVIVQFEIEVKLFNGFKSPFKTSKWITVTQWEEIKRRLQKFIRNRLKPEESQKHIEFIADETLLVNVNVLPKEKSYIDISKLKSYYTLDWFAAVKVSRLKVQAEVVEAEQTSSQVSIKATQIHSTPKRKESFKDRESQPVILDKSDSSVEYLCSPARGSQNECSPIKNDIDHPECTSKSNNYSLKTRSKARHLDTMKVTETPSSTVQKLSDSVENDRRDVSSPSCQRSFEIFPKQLKKRELQPLTVGTPIANKNKRKIAESTVKTTKKRKEKRENREPKLEQILKKDGAQKDPLVTFDSEKMKRMEEFIANSKQRQERMEERREELKDFKALDCIDLCNDELKWYVTEFESKIMEFYSSSRPSRNKKLNSVLLTTANILSESQVDFVMKEIENLRDPSERGYKEEILTEIILPEFILFVFAQKFSYSNETALEHLKVREEFLLLNGKDETF